MSTEVVDQIVCNLRASSVAFSTEVSPTSAAATVTSSLVIITAPTSTGWKVKMKFGSDISSEIDYIKTTDLVVVALPEWTFDRKRISANSNLNPNPEAQKPIQENEMTSFFRQVSRYVETRETEFAYIWFGNHGWG